MVGRMPHLALHAQDLEQYTHYIKYSEGYHLRASMAKGPNKQWSVKRHGTGFGSRLQAIKAGIARWLPATMVLPLFMLLITGMMFAVVGPVYVAYLKSTVSNTAPAIYCALNVTDKLGASGVGCQEHDIAVSELPDQNQLTGLYMTARFTQLNLPAATATLVLEVAALGDMVGERGEVNIPTNTNLSVVVSSVTTNIKNGDRPPRVSTDLDLRSRRSLYQYPFDEYEADVDVKAFVSNANVSFFVPVIFELQTSVPSFTLKADTDDQAKHVFVTTDVTEVQTKVRLQRSMATRFFSVFIVIAMWVLSGSVFVYVVDLVYVRPHEIKTDDAALVTGVMFSLPAVRAVQPGLPEAGASVDVLGYFWNMTLVVMSAVLVLCGIVGQYIIEYRVQQQQRQLQKAGNHLNHDTTPDYHLDVEIISPSPPHVGYMEDIKL